MSTNCRQLDYGTLHSLCLVTLRSNSLDQQVVVVCICYLIRQSRRRATSKYVWSGSISLLLQWFTELNSQSQWSFPQMINWFQHAESAEKLCWKHHNRCVMALRDTGRPILYLKAGCILREASCYSVYSLCAKLSYPAVISYMMEIYE